MLFKVSNIRKVFESLICLLVLAFIFYKFSTKFHTTYLLLALITIGTIVIVLIFINKDYYLLEKQKLKIHNGKDNEIIQINDILYIEKTTFIGTNGFKNSAGGISEEYKIVTKNGKIEIDCSLQNKKEKDLIEVLNRSYKKKITDATNLCGKDI